jgi:hypothetical protein
MAPLLEQRHALYDIIAVQEPWLNPQIDTTYCPRRCQYNLVFPQQGRARTALFINKQLPIAKWYAGQEPDYCWVKLELDSGPITIHNVYSESPGSYVTTEWNTPIHQIIEAIKAPGRHLVVGDFNLHHPLWGGQAVLRAHAGAALLADSIRTGHLDLLLEPGTVTREKHGNASSTLDLALSTPNLTLWISSCKLANHQGSDHRPIETTIQISCQARTSLAPKRNYKKIDTDMALAGARWLQVPSWDLTTAWEIDSYSDYLVGFIQELISQTVPYKTPSTHAQAWWTPEVSKAINTERRAHRQWSLNRTEHNWNDYVVASKAKRQQIASAKQAFWRKSVHEAAVSLEGI